MIKSEVDSVYTDDMALAAYLQMKGVGSEAIHYDADTRICHWTFIGPRALEETAIFLNNGSLVNPREFTRFYAHVKNQMWAVRNEAERGRHG